MTLLYPNIRNCDENLFKYLFETSQIQNLELKKVQKLKWQFCLF